MIMCIIKIMPQATPGRADPLWRKLIIGVVVLAVCVFVSGPGWANNIEVSSVKRFSQVPGSHWMVQFNILWTNSWRCDLAGAGQSAPYNYDAAWVFMKYRTNVSAGAWGEWKHASLSTSVSDHVAPAGSTINVGMSPTTNDAGETATNGIGVFIYRGANGYGLFTANKVQLRWNYPSDSVADSAGLEVKVCAIEMVYVPTGAFYLGSTTDGTEANRFYAGDAGGVSTNTPFLVTNENYQVEIGNAAGQLFYITNNTYGGDQAGILSNAFPKGFNAFYGMKYEITQGQYVDFLNIINSNQASYRWYATAIPNNRYAITNVSGSYASSNLYVACNYMSWADLAAYLDWAGLRPMTELEFEKACRGTNYPVAQEYAWGNSTFPTYPTGITNNGAANEAPSNTTANCNSEFQTYVQGPMRVGCMGIGNGTRARTGAGYYGMMELSGNLFERTVTVGNADGRSFSAVHGNGVLSSNGDADVTCWPGSSASGAGYRGGGWGYNSSSPEVKTANRGRSAETRNDRSVYCGGRGVRSAP